MDHRYGFALVVFLSVALAACGQQVTPNPPGAGPGGLLPGYASVKFDVAGPFNFSSYRYFFVFNTSGNGTTPVTNTQQTNFAGYSFAIEVGGFPGSTFASAYQYVRSSGCGNGCPPGYVPIGTTPAQFQYYPDSNGSGTEFNVVFAPVIAKGISTPAPGHTSPPVASTWLFNAFTTQPNTTAQLTFVDSLGGSPIDTSYSSPAFNMNTQFDQVIYATSPIGQMDPAAQIVSVEFANNPATPSPSPP